VISGADLIRAGQGRYTDDALADETVERVWEAVRAECGWHIGPVRRETLVVDGSGGELLQLRSLRVVQVHSVRELGDELSPTAFMWSADGSMKRRDGRWTDEWRGVEVDLDHGFDSTEALDRLVLRVAMREMTTPAGQLGVRVGQVDEQFGSPIDWTSSERATLARYTVTTGD